MTNETKHAGVWMYKDTLGQWKPFLTERHRQDTIDSGDWEVREFFSHASPVDAAVHPMTNETGRAGLLPCPFCGGEAEFKPYKKDGLTIKCKSFGCVRRDQRVLRQSIDWLREAMAKDWNTRTNPPPVDAADDEESICQLGAVILRDDPIPQVRQSPGDAAVERDATRYRWLRTHFKFANDSTREIWFDGDTLVDEPSELDESIDVAITAQQQESGHE